jgi:hypothetical protein
MMSMLVTYWELATLAVKSAHQAAVVRVTFSDQGFDVVTPDAAGSIAFGAHAAWRRAILTKLVLVHENDVSNLNLHVASSRDVSCSKRRPRNHVS